MTIYRLSFPEGEPVNTEIDIQGQAAGMVVRHIEDLKALSPGTFNLAPACWGEKANYGHFLDVSSMGDAVYRAEPKYSDSGLSERGIDGFGPVKRGRREIKIPEEQPVAIVAGGMRERRGIGIFEIIIHQDGTSPINIHN